MRFFFALTLVFAAWPTMAQDGGGLHKEDDHQTKAVAFDPIMAAARERMMHECDTWFGYGDFLLVISNQEILVAAEPMDEENTSLLVWMYMNIERPDLQWSAACRFADQNPAYVDAKYYEAEFLFAKKMYAKIPALLEPVIAKTPPPDANAFRFLAHSYNRMGYYEDAIRVWDALIKINPKDGQALVNRSNVLKKIKK